MVLRINDADSLLPGARRSSEISILQATSEQGIAPSLLYVEEEAKYLVSAYIENSLLPQLQLDTIFVDQAFSLLNRCHQLDVEAPGIDYAGHIEQYWQIIAHNNQPINPTLIEQRGPMQVLLGKLINSGTPTGLCHHDPVITNFVGNADRLYLIDWEYAAHGLLIMDYAALSIEWGIDDTLLVAQTAINPELLTMAKTLYRYLCQLWQAATVRTPGI